MHHPVSDEHRHPASALACVLTWNTVVCGVQSTACIALLLLMLTAMIMPMAQRLRADSTSDTARAAMAALRVTTSQAALPASQPAADVVGEAAMAGAPVPSAASNAAAAVAPQAAATPESEPAVGVSRVSGEVQKVWQSSSDDRSPCGKQADLV